MGCHFLLQCMKVKSESEVSQLCPTLRDPIDCSLPGSSIHGIFWATQEIGGVAGGWCISPFYQDSSRSMATFSSGTHHHEGGLRRGLGSSGSQVRPSFLPWDPSSPLQPSPRSPSPSCQSQWEARPSAGGGGERQVWPLHYSCGHLSCFPG